MAKGILQTETGAVEIAVKTLKAGVSQGDEVRFLQEAAINGQFQHPNIVKLLGVVTVGEPVSYSTSYLADCYLAIDKLLTEVTLFFHR